MDETTPALASSRSLEGQKDISLKGVHNKSPNSDQHVVDKSIGLNKSPNSNQHQNGELDKNPKSDPENSTDPLNILNSNQHQSGEPGKSPKSNLQNSIEPNKIHKTDEEHDKSLNSDHRKRSILSSENVAVLTVDNNKHCFANIDLCLDDEKTFKTDPFSNEADLKKESDKIDKKCNKFLEARQRVKSVLEQVSVQHNELPLHPNWHQKLKHSLLLPPHGPAAEYSTLILIVLTFWITCMAMFGKIAVPPDGTHFLLIALVVVATLVGKVFTLIQLPALLGMLVTGIALKNLPGVTFDDHWQSYSQTLRGVALVVILLRAGLGLDPVALRRLSGMVFRLAFIPCLMEAATVAVASHFLLDLPWLWGFMLGFVLAAVSPAVVVPGLLALQEEGYGVAKGIPTLVIAASSVDDVLAISAFTVLLGVTFKPNTNLVGVILQGPIEAIVGLLFGIFWGILVTYLPGREAANKNTGRLIILLGGALLAMFGSSAKGVELPGSGALAVLVMAFVAGLGWRKQGWGDDNPVSEALAKFWIILQPLLFGLIGTEIRINELEPSTLGMGVLVLIIGLSLRVLASFGAVSFGDLTLKERFFVSLAWLPKATVQAALGPLALDNAKSLGSDREDGPMLIAYGEKVLTIAVLVILITAPIGAIAIRLSGPRWLSRGTDKSDVEKLSVE